jgi:hypothetical protein
MATKKKKSPGVFGIMSKGMNAMSDIMGTTAAVKVGGNLVRNIGRSAKGKAPIPLYKKGDYKSLAKDVLGIATLGATSLGAIKGLGATAKAAQPVMKEATTTATEKFESYMRNADRGISKSYRAFKALLPK